MAGVQEYQRVQIESSPLEKVNGVAAADVVPEAVAYAVLAGALVMLAESFGRDVLWLWRRRGDPHEVPALVADRAAG